MRNYLVLGFILLSFLAKSQEEEKVSVEKNLNSIQLGLFYSLSYQNEIRLDRKITLKSEIGLETGRATIEYPNQHKETSFLILPFISVEPRWYYSLDRRSRLKKNIRYNSSNYVSLLTSFHSSKTALVNTKDFKINPFISIIPEYGIKRSFGKKFFADYSGGIGYRHNFHDKNYSGSDNKNEIAVNLQVKLGYIF